ncbi:MAG: acyl carrier protein [Planctomycetota bacterium]
MTPEPDLDATLGALLSRALGRPVGAGEAVARDDEPGWNSLVHMELVFMLEDEFDVRFEAEEIPELSSRSAIAERVRARRNPSAQGASGAR